MMNRLLKDGVIIIMKDQVTSRNTQRRSYGRFHVSSILRSNNGFRQLFIRNQNHYDLTKCIYKRDWTEATSPHTNSAPLFYCSFILHILTFNRSTQNLAVSSQQQKAFILHRSLLCHPHSCLSDPQISPYSWEVQQIVSSHRHKRLAIHNYVVIHSQFIRIHFLHSANTRLTPSLVKTAITAVSVSHSLSINLQSTCFQCIQ